MKRPIFLLFACISLAVACPMHGAENVTLCDELVAHPLDPDRLTVGVPSAKVLHEEGIAACEAAVANDPDSPRLNYQLARVYFYDGQTAKAMPLLEYAAAAAYRQAEFVLGYIIEGGRQGVPRDPCRAEDLWARSARAGRLAAMVSYPHHVLRGRFSDCKLQVSDAEMMVFLERAKQRKLNYYQTVLVDDLIEDLEAKSRRDQSTR